MYSLYIYRLYIYSLFVYLENIKQYIKTTEKSHFMITEILDNTGDLENSKKTNPPKY